jgi:hypothetical protein
MNPLKRSIEKRANGWIAEESDVMHPRKSSNRRSSTTAYIAGYGVGIGICELYIFLVDTLGLDAFRSSLSPALSMLLGMLVLFPGVLLGIEIGKILSKKLKERWAK